MTIDELVKPLTPAQVEAALYSAMVGRGLVTTDWKPGAVVRTIVTALAIVLAALTVLIAFIAKSGFLEFATGPWLTLVARHVYGTERILETFATGIVRITNVTGAGSFIGVQTGDLVVKATTGPAAGKTYRSTAGFSLPAIAAAFVDVPVRADEAGASSSTGAGTITSFVTTFVGCSVTNAASLVGSDRERDEALRARARAKTGVLSPNGPRDAYAYIATSAKRTNGTAIGVTRVRCIADGRGGVDVYVADADGTLTGTVGDLDSDLGIVDRDIQEKVVPLAVTARTHASTPSNLAVSYELWVDTAIGLAGAELAAAIQTALDAYAGSVAIGGERIPSVSGGYVFRSAIGGVISGVVGTDHLIRLDVLTPVADVPISTTSAPVLGTVTFDINLVSSAGLV